MKMLRLRAKQRKIEHPDFATGGGDSFSSDSDNFFFGDNGDPTLLSIRA
jgi:hypothetical protein